MKRLGCLIALAFVVLTANAAPPELRVRAGGHERVDTIVMFGAAPESIAPGYYIDTAAKDGGQQDVVYIGRDRSGWIRLRQLAAHSTRVYTGLVQFSFTEPQGFFSLGKGAWAMRNGEGEVVYQAEPGPFPRADIDPAYRRGGYLHPVTTPSGQVVTDDFPPNHIHQHGIWFAWTKTKVGGRGPDFWNMGKGSGRVVFDQILEKTSSNLFSSIRSRHYYEDLTGESPVRILEEEWETTLYPDGSIPKPYRYFDVSVLQKRLGSEPLVLPQYRYGGLGVRGRWEWNGPGDACRFLTADGERDRIAAHTQRSRWIAMYGAVEPEGFAGIAILDHPENFRSPQPMRVHPTEPFFCYAPSQLGDWHIGEESDYSSRYRFVTFDGEPDPGLLDRLWNDYAHPPQVEWLDPN